MRHGPQLGKAPVSWGRAANRKAESVDFGAEEGKPCAAAGTRWVQKRGQPVVSKKVRKGFVEAFDQET